MNRPVLVRQCPIGTAATPQKALRLARRFAGPADRMALRAGFALSVRATDDAYHVTLNQKGV